MHQLNVLIKNNRIWVPRDYQENLSENFCEFRVSSKSNKTSFISKLSKDGRLVIPKAARTKLSDGKAVLSFTVLKNVRTRRLCIGRQFDVLSTVPKKTLSGFPILACKRGDDVFTWYFASKGRPNELTLKRYVDPQVCRMLGYYRAEGGKPKLAKRRGREFSFTNKSLDIVKDFLKHFELLSNVAGIKAGITFNPNYSGQSKIVEAVKRLGVDSVSIRTAPRIRTFVIRLYAGNSLLSEIVDQFENRIRKYIISNRDVYCALEYIRGVLSGDGSIYFWTDLKGSMHSRLQIFESDDRVAKDFVMILDFFGIKSNISRTPGKNMSVVTAYLNWEGLLSVLKHDLFPFRRAASEYAIRKHKRFRSLKHLIGLSNGFTSLEFREKSKTGQPYASTWLRDRRREGIISGDFETGWTLTQKGVDVVNVLRSL